MNSYLKGKDYELFVLDYLKNIFRFCLIMVQPPLNILIKANIQLNYSNNSNTFLNILNSYTIQNPNLNISKLIYVFLILSTIEIFVLIFLFNVKIIFSSFNAKIYYNFIFPKSSYQFFSFL